MTLAANRRIDKLTEEATLHPPYLTGAVTGSTADGLTARPGAGAVAGRADLGTRNFYLFLTAQGRLFKG
jgi:hypothetical protein